MFRKYMIISLAAIVVFGTTACTSKKSSDDSADVEQNAGDESIESAEATDNNDDLATDKSSGAVADMGGTSDELAPEEKLPAETPPAAVADNAVAPSDLSETPPADQAQATAPASDTPPPPQEMAATDTPPPPAEPVAPPTPEPSLNESKPAAVGALRKIDTQPRKQGKSTLNAVYIARQGDTPENISQKVFGSNDRVKELCKANSYNCSRSVKVGDKFYYQSPQRPTDDAVVKTFYEDAGIAPAIYTAKSGDNIRKVGKQLLGDERSWMELWATNDVESKGKLDEGTQLKYWPTQEGAAPTQTLAKTEGATPPADAAAPDAAAEQAATPPPTEQAATPPPPPPDNMPPPPPAPDQAANQAAASGTIEPPPPPPPPPPPDQASNRKEPPPMPPEAAAGALSDPNQTMALGIGAVLLLAAAALFISIRKKRAKRQIDFNTATQTQIE